MKLDYSSLKDEYARLWQSMEVRPNKRGPVEVTAKKIISYREIYEQVEAATNVPWYVVGIIHAMEASCNFKCHLHNGDPLTAKTRQVPKGRPSKGKAPFSWHESACDALQMHNLHKVKEWPVERICYELERYNGWGYRRYHPETLSAYLWSYTSHYTKGKYVKDGKWSPVAVSSQSGAMAILFVMMDLCPDARPQLEGVVDDVDDKPFPKADGPLADVKPNDLDSRTVDAAQKLETAGKIAIGVTAAAKGVSEAIAPSALPAPPPVPPIEVSDITEKITAFQHLMEGANAVGRLVTENLWVSGIVIGFVAVVFGRRIVNWYLDDVRTGRREAKLKDQ